MITPLSSFSIKLSAVMVDRPMILFNQSAKSSLRGLKQACCNLMILAVYSSALVTANRASPKGSWSSIGVGLTSNRWPLPLGEFILLV